MRATYDKTVNVIFVELTETEVNQYCAKKLSERHLDLGYDGEFYYHTIPCGQNFFQMTERHGGYQPWGPDDLRRAVRAAIANKYVAWNCPSGQEEFKAYKAEWNRVFQGLLRNVRLKFPTGKHQRVRLSKEEFEYRKWWRRQHVV